jgi:hypothetical protein
MHKTLRTLARVAFVLLLPHFQGLLEQKIVPNLSWGAGTGHHLLPA